MSGRKIHPALAIFLLAPTLMFASDMQPVRTASQPLRTAADKRVWTEEDLVALRGISPVMDSGLRPAAEVSRTGDAPARYTRLRDPRWYREQLEPLRAELELTDAELRRFRNELRSGKGGTNAIDLYRDTEGITPESEVALLIRHRAVILMQIDVLEDLAQKNEVLPGELRQDRSAEERAYTAYLGAVAQLEPQPEKPQNEAQWRSRFAMIRERLDFAQRELIVLQREWSASLVQYYPNPYKALREEYTRGELNGLEKKIREKKAEIVQLKQSLSDLEDDLRRAGGPPGWSRE